MEAKHLIESLTEEQIILILTKELGSNLPKVAPNALLFQSVCHNIPADSNSYKLYYYTETRRFKCFTQCGESFNIISLVMKVKDLGFAEAIRFICNSLNIETSGYTRLVGFKEDFEDLNFLKKYDKRVCEVSPKEDINIYNDNILRVYHKNIFYDGWINEGISIDTMKKYEIHYDSIENRIIIPHRNINGELIGVKTRYINRSDVKYLPLTFNGLTYKYPTGRNLYGVHINKETIKKNRKVVLFEAEKSVQMAHSYYGDNNFCLALTGSNLTKEQIAILLELGVDEIIIAVDKEYSTHEEMFKYSEKIRKVFINKLISFFSVSVIWDTENKLELKDSPIDKGEAVFEYLFDNRIRIKE